MGLSQKVLALLSLTVMLSPLAAEEEKTAPVSEESASVNKQHIPYLMQIREYKSAIELYQRYRTALGRHDFEVLQQIGTILLEQGGYSSDQEIQMISIFGSAIAGLSSSLQILEAGISCPNPEIQLAAIQYLGGIHDDRCDELLIKAMRSDFFASRMEAGYLLSMRKHRAAVGQIEALMYRLPSPFRFFFPQFFALIGTTDAISVLRHLIDDQNLQTRIEAILCAARYGRDDLLPKIRTATSHLNMAEQEACAAALGYLKDSKSIPKLQKLAKSQSQNVSLAAYHSLHLLGDSAATAKIFEFAESKNVFAITMLGDISGSEDLLYKIMKEGDLQISYNAAMALLKRKDIRALPIIYEILLRDTRDLGFMPQFSVGRSMMAWKIVPSTLQHMKNATFDIPAVSLQLREMLLRECLELPENNFIDVANRIFFHAQIDLVPLLVGLLENLKTPDAISLLQHKAQKAGAPLTRAYCNLVLYRMNIEGPYEERVREWILQKKHNDLIRFRPMLPYSQRIKDTPFDLTPEESSRLLIESYQALADRHDLKGIDALLEVIKDGNSKNRYALAGLLIRAVQ